MRFAALYLWHAGEETRTVGGVVVSFGRGLLVPRQGRVMRVLGGGLTVTMSATIAARTNRVALVRIPQNDVMTVFAAKALAASESQSWQFGGDAPSADVPAGQTYIPLEGGLWIPYGLALWVYQSTAATVGDKLSGCLIVEEYDV